MHKVVIEVDEPPERFAAADLAMRSDGSILIADPDGGGVYALNEEAGDCPKIAGAPLDGKPKPLEGDALSVRICPSAVCTDIYDRAYLDGTSRLDVGGKLVLTTPRGIDVPRFCKVALDFRGYLWGCDKKARVFCYAPPIGLAVAPGLKAARQRSPSAQIIYRSCSIFQC